MKQFIMGFPYENRTFTATAYITLEEAVLASAYISLSSVCCSTNQKQLKEPCTEPFTDQSLCIPNVT